MLCHVAGNCLSSIDCRLASSEEEEEDEAYPHESGCFNHPSEGIAYMGRWFSASVAACVLLFARVTMTGSAMGSCPLSSPATAKAGVDTEAEDVLDRRLEIATGGANAAGGKACFDAPCARRAE